MKPPDLSTAIQFLSIWCKKWIFLWFLLSICVVWRSSCKWYFCVGFDEASIRSIAAWYLRDMYNGMLPRGHVASFCRCPAPSSIDIIDGWRGCALTKQKFSIHHTFKLQSDIIKWLLNKPSSILFGGLADSFVHKRLWIISRILISCMVETSREICDKNSSVWEF